MIFFSHFFSVFLQNDRGAERGGEWGENDGARGGKHTQTIKIYSSNSSSGDSRLAARVDGKGLICADRGWKYVSGCSVAKSGTLSNDAGASASGGGDSAATSLRRRLDFFSASACNDDGDAAAPFFRFS